MVGIRVEGIRKSYGDVDVLKGIDLDIRHSEFVVFVGPSGCGKSTLLRMIAGLERPTQGEIFFDGKPFTHVAPARRNVAMVFQSYALYPHMTVAENMTMSLRLAGVNARERRERAAQVAQTLQLSSLLDRKPGALSGGQRQRVAIGRAIVRNPDVFLFDEPLSNLDASLRVETRIGITKLHHALDSTMIYVTHDQVEAMTMADRIVILDQGRIAQIGTPLELYRNPANIFVAGFLGSPKMNFVPVTETGRLDGKLRVTLPGETDVSLDVRVEGSHPVSTLGIRPEHLKISASGQFGGRVTAVEHLGSEALVYVEGRNGTFMIKTGEDVEARVDDIIAFEPDPGAVHLFDAAGITIPKAGRPSSDIRQETARSISG